MGTARSVVIALLALPSAACSTFTVQDVYNPIGRTSFYSADGAVVSMWIAPHTRVYAIGPVGAPLVPTQTRPSKQDTLSLTLILRLEKQLDFSFQTLPCLEMGSEKLCPTAVDVSAVAMYRDDGSKYKDKHPRWHQLLEFSQKKGFQVHPGDDASRHRLTRQTIFDHYGYSGATWGYLHLNITYRYDCRRACSDTLRLDTSDLASVGSISAFTGVFSFAKTAETQYDPLAPVQ
jgi:hypothetical protein